MAANTANRPLSRSRVRAFADAIRRADWLVTHQGIVFGTNGGAGGGQRRLAEIIEADLPVELATLTEPDTCDVLDTGKRRNVWPPAGH